jgi:hypothetical protein
MASRNIPCGQLAEWRWLAGRCARALPGSPSQIFGAWNTGPARQASAKPHGPHLEAPEIWQCPREAGWQLGCLHSNQKGAATNGAGQKALTTTQLHSLLLG